MKNNIKKYILEKYKNANGKFNNTWAIFLMLIFLQKELMSPKISLSRNIGHDNSDSLQ